jgi:hypothetical protein
VRDRIGREIATPRGDMVTEEISTPDERAWGVDLTRHFPGLPSGSFVTEEFWLIVARRAMMRLHPPAAHCDRLVTGPISHSGR